MVDFAISQEIAEDLMEQYCNENPGHWFSCEQISSIGEGREVTGGQK